MQDRTLSTWILYSVGAMALLSGACSGEEGAGGEGSLQSSCVSNQLNLDRTLSDGEACDNFGYSDCLGFASECINYCAHKFCQPMPCETSADCDANFADPGPGRGFLCEDYVVSGKAYGSWCKVDEVCDEGTLNCPCAPGNVCGPDPFGLGNMNCVDGTCESSCPAACIQGSVCCGGTLCSGNCIGTPCCS